MAGSHDDGEPVMADDPAAQPGGPPRSLDDPQIRGPLGYVADDRLGIDRGQHDIGGRAARWPAAARNDISQVGSSCSAIVELELTPAAPAVRSAAIPASSPAATSSSRDAHSAITPP